MVVIKQDLERKEEPGTWVGLLTPKGRRAGMTCPDCDRMLSLSNHEIADDGHVTPSVVCPYDGCNFHDFVTLENWRPNP